MNKLGIIVAMTAEYELVKSLLGNPREKQRNNLR